MNDKNLIFKPLKKPQVVQYRSESRRQYKPLHLRHGTPAQKVSRSTQAAPSNL